MSSGFLLKLEFTYTVPTDLKPISTALALSKALSRYKKVSLVMTMKCHYTPVRWEDLENPILLLLLLLSVAADKARGTPSSHLSWVSYFQSMLLEF